MMKPSEIKEQLGAMGRKPNKRLGQHFLVDQSVLNAAVQAAGIKKGDVVLEVGPGLGVLTRELLDRGASVVAIEQDRAFADMLEETFRDQDFRVVRGDAASVHWHELVGKGPWKFVSNLPYAITSLALRKALYAPRPPQTVVVLIQKEVAERIMATREKRTSLLSLMVALTSESRRIVRRVPPRCFYPAPKVNSALIEIIPLSVRDRQKRWGVDPEQIMQVAKIGFAHPRKLLTSNLAGGAWRAMPKQEIEHMIESVGASPTSRAENLSVEQWAALAVAFAQSSK